MSATLLACIMTSANRPGGRHGLNERPAGDDGRSRTRLKCILAKIFNQQDKLREFEVKGEFFYTRAAGHQAYDIRCLPVPRYITTWEGFGQALSAIDHCNFSVELYCPADRGALRRAVVIQRFREAMQRGEAAHHDLKRALALAAILVMFEAWYEVER
jgi:hypothetical protein